MNLYMAIAVQGISIFSSTVSLNGSSLEGAGSLLEAMPPSGFLAFLIAALTVL